MNEFIKVDYEVHATQFSIMKALDKLSTKPILSYDCETQSQYSLEERAEAKDLLKNHIDGLTPEDRKLCKLVSKSSGLSHPKITKVTHFLFGLSEDYSVILIAYTPTVEKLICDWLVNYTGKLLTWNALFDLKIVYHHTGKFPVDFEDGQLLAKCLINHADNWKSRVGLKHLMGEYYDPTWTSLDSEGYDNIDYKNEAFLRYCSIDSASTYKAWNILQEMIDETY